MAKMYSDEEKRKWEHTAEEQKKQMQDMIKNLTDTWQENPETIAEMLEFGSRIYHYSMRNNMLIYAQNPHATYAQSFKAWKEMGASVKKGEKGCRVYVPVNATILKIDGHLVPLEQATKEQMLQYKAGEIESITRQHFKIGTVFDISQTTYPKEKYPQLFNMGYDSALHAAVVQGLTKYARNSLQCGVETVDLKSIALRGDYSPQMNRIRLNEMLEDTEKLSTMSHELGHALLHKTLPIGKSAAQVELEADALGIMLESHFGIALTESRKRHLVSNYNTYHEAYKKAPEGQKPDGFGQVINHVFETFRKEIPAISEYVEKQIQIEEQALAKKGVQINSHLKEYPYIEEQPEVGKEEISDRIKREINILDYAGIHGIELQRVGRYYTIKGHDSVRIDPDKNCFWRNSGIGQTTTGSVIDFANAFVHDEDLHESLKELSGLVGGNLSPAKAFSTVNQRKKEEWVQKPLEENLPKRAENMHRVYAYLTQTRFVEPNVVQDFVDRKMLYQDIKGNCVFVAYDETKKPVFASFRGTLSERKFLGDVSGSNYREGFYINNNADRLIVTESVIDAMSVMSILHGQGVDYKQYDYLPLNSADKHGTLLAHLAGEPKEQVLLALDHDLAGVKNMQLLKEEILEEIGMRPEQITFHVPETKDWNEELLNTMRHLRPISELDFLRAVPLPEIHYCAVQSTQYMEETGFHKRNGQDQYRLVQLNEQGEIVPMEIKRNVIFRHPDELKELIPEMYEEVPYSKLLKFQEEMAMNRGAENLKEERIQHEEGQQPVSKEQKETQDQDMETRLPFQSENGITVKGFDLEDGMIVAKFIQDGVESNEAVYRQDGRYYTETGYAFDNSYVKIELTEEQQDELEAYISEHGLKLDKDSMLLMVEEAAEQIRDEEPGLERTGTDFLNALQQQEFQAEEIQPEPEMAMGIGG